MVPRAEFVEERLAALIDFDPATGAIPSALLLDAGPPLCWDDVFKVARILQRSRRVTAPGSQSSGLGSALAPTASFGAFSTRHFLAAQSQAFSNLPQSQVGQQHIDMSMRNAAHAAAGEVEQEARAPAGAPRPLTTALNAALALTAAAATGGTEGVTALGCAVAEMPRNLQVLETMERQGYDPTASPYLSTAAMTLDTISSAFISSAARELLRYEGSFVGPDVPPERKATSERVIKLVLRGKPLSVNDALLTPSAATSLLSAWDSSVDTAASLHSGLKFSRSSAKWSIFSNGLPLAPTSFTPPQSRLGSGTAQRKSRSQSCVTFSLGACVFSRLMPSISMRAVALSDLGTRPIILHLQRRMTL